eukprot:CAMPEP_0202708488 /NCGR_PEP_ID=MMETSP1385-20130828/20681_1 /ASSEMBLY_ACC=CAM_ASM_000861 /TAXON_ID=933848 /ORGANISM="Elphidium margaritaceum" /LENGTH=716 /DNA_ID=CAMNT_0049367473 /DNA_START=13 /DNA_END=2163 /DNA_ORIENTATION=-
MTTQNGVRSKEEIIKARKKNYRVHGNKGVYCGGEWIPIEECAEWQCPKQCQNNHDAVLKKTQNAELTIDDDENIMYDVAIIGAGCVGSCIARELSKYQLKVLLLERDDDVTQGATKGNSGIIHAGYDDQPGSVRSKFCWKGNQMFAALDQQLKFGYLKNGSMVIARNADEYKHLQSLLERGQKNGVERLRIVEKAELHTMEPYLADDCIAALYSPDAGTVTPYEFAIATAENAANNGVQIRTRHEVVGVQPAQAQSTGGGGQYFQIAIKRWSYSATSDANQVSVDHAARRMFEEPTPLMQRMEFKLLVPCAVSIGAVCVMFDSEELQVYKYALLSVLALVLVVVVGLLLFVSRTTSGQQNTSLLFHQQSASAHAQNVDYASMAATSANKYMRARYVINSAGLFADKIARMIGDASFTIKPRLGEYLLLHKDAGHLAGATLFPCPDTKLKTKGVLVQTTLWGNLILGPTARDVYKEQTQKDSAEDIMRFLLRKSKQLVPSIDASMVIHSFAGSRAKSDRGDWIIEQTKVTGAADKALRFFHVAGIDSPGLAGSPAIAEYVVQQLLSKQGGLALVANKQFNPFRRPLIFPKNGWKGLKLKQLPEREQVQLSANEQDWKKTVVCKCEKVTEYEIVDAMRRNGASVDTTQAIRRRTRAGMGGCQAQPSNCNCELYVAKLIALEKKRNVDQVGRRPWPATSILKQRWLSDDDKQYLKNLVK